MELTKQQKQLIWAAVIIAAIAILAPYLGLIPKFAISDSNFLLNSNNTFSPNDPIFTYLISNAVISNGSFSFTHAGINYTNVSSGKIYYFIDGMDNNYTAYTDIPDVTGAHMIYKVQIFVTPDNTQFNVLIYSLSYLQQNVQLNVTSSQICVGVGGNYTESKETCTCPNGNIWYDNSTSKVCGPVINTVTNTVNVQPSFLQEYGIAIIVIIISGIVIFLMRRKK